MLIILKHVLRNIKEKKGRSLLIIISLLIASCVFILNLTIPKQIIEADKNKTINLIGKSDVLVMSYDNFDFNDLKINKEKIKYVGANQVNLIHKDKTFSIYGTQISKANELNLIDVNELKDDEIVISKSSAEKFGYKEKDTITISLEDKEYTLKIAKILDGKGLLYLKSYSGVVNSETFKKISGLTDDNYMMYFVDLENDEKIDEFAKYIEKNNENYFAEKLIDEKAIEEGNSYVSMILLIIFVMAVIMIFFVVNTLNKMVILERMPVIGTFRSIGATKGKMNFILIFENAMYGLIGGILGSGLTILINGLCVKLLSGGTTKIDTAVPISNIIWGILFAILLEVIMSLGAIIRSNKYSIKQIMFDGISSKYKLNKITSIISIGLIAISIVLYYCTGDNNLLLDLVKIVAFWVGIAMCIPLIMMILSKILSFVAKKIGNGAFILACKNLGYNKMIVSSARLVVISISVMLVILNISATFDKMLNSFSYQFRGYDIFIRDLNQEYTTYEKLLDIKGIKSIENVYMYSQENTTYNDGKKFDVNPIILGMKNSRPDIEEYDYKIKDLKEDELLIDKIFAENNNLKVGDKIKIKYENKEFEYKIVGTVNSFFYSIQREIMIVNEEHFINNISKIPFQIAVSTNSKYDIDNIVKDIENTLKDPDVSVITVESFVESQRQNIHTIMYLFYIIIGFAVGLSFVGIINNQIISFMERTKEIAVLNSVCMSKGQIIRMLITENITSNLCACLVGVGASAISVKIMGSVLNGMKLYFDIKFDFAVAGMFIGIVFAVLLLTVIIPIKKIRKINIVEAIKYE